MKCAMCPHTFGPAEARLLVPCSHGQTMHLGCPEPPQYLCHPCLELVLGPEAYERLELVTAC